MKRLEYFREKVSTLFLLRIALRYVWRAGRGWAATSFVMVFVQGLMPLASLYLMKLVVDSATKGLSSPDKLAAAKETGWLILVAGAVIIGTSALGSVFQIIKDHGSKAFVDYLQGVIHEKSVRLDLEYYENPGHYDTLHRAQQDGAFRPLSISDGLMRLGQNAISFVAIMTLLISLHWGVGLILLAGAVPSLAIRTAHSRKVYEWRRKNTSAERMSAYFNWLLTTGRPAKEIRVFNLGPLFARRYRELQQRLRTESSKMLVRGTIADLLMQCIGVISVFAAFAILAYRTIHGESSVGELAMYYQAIQQGLGHLRGIIGNLGNLYEDSLFLSNFDEFMKLEQAVKEPVNPKPVPSPMKEGIVFDRVNFAYPGDNRQVLHEVSLSMKPGEVVGLLGENGAGKSTLIKLLCRLYDPVSGSITIDGIDLRSFRSSDWRREICPIFQDYVEFSLSAGENIWLGEVERSYDLNRVSEAARMAGADRFIERLPKLYNTELGRMFENGAQLSVGEWQRVATARALYRSGLVLILDEPTSSQDIEAEHEFCQRIAGFAKDRVVILISHRLSTLKAANRIYLLKEGRIIESGSHEELARRGGKFAELLKLQRTPSN